MSEKRLPALISGGRVPAAGAFERLEPCAGKLASKVLRGGGGGIAVPLPDNQVHYVLDTFFREDERRIRNGQVARDVATLRRTALNLLRRLGGRSIPEEADRVKADPTLLLPLIGSLREVE